MYNSSSFPKHVIIKIVAKVYIEGLLVYNVHIKIANQDSRSLNYKIKNE